MIYPEQDMNNWSYCDASDNHGNIDIQYTKVQEGAGCWSYCDTAVILANADYYYTKEQTDKKFDEYSGVTEEEVEELIDEKIQTKADKSEVNTLAEQVRNNTQAILNRYTKSEVNNLLAQYKTKLEANRDMADYAAIHGDVLSLNDKNIGI